VEVPLNYLLLFSPVLLLLGASAALAWGSCAATAELRVCHMLLLVLVLVLVEQGRN
jgi:hypothetical protein